MTVVVAGSLHLDVVVRAPHMPAIDETVAGRGVDYVFGGKGGNQALALAKLGAKVTMAGRAGSDGFGDMIRRKLKTTGVDLSLLQQDDGPSGMSVAIIDAKGDYGAVIVSAANLALDADKIHLPWDTSLVLLQNEIPEKVNTAVAKAAKSIGSAVWLNAAPARPLSDELVSNVDLLIVNRVEAAYYSPVPPNLEVLTTLGADGVLYRERSWPAPRVEVLSTHGAGDMFVGALAARVTDGDRVEQAIPFAQAAAAWHVSTDASVRDAQRADTLNALLRDQLIP